jgi:hypothetical protein
MRKTALLALPALALLTAPSLFAGLLVYQIAADAPVSVFVDDAPRMKATRAGEADSTANDVVPAK